MRRPTSFEGWALLALVVVGVVEALRWAVAELLQRWYLIPLMVIVAAVVGGVYLAGRRAAWEAAARRMARFGMTAEQIDALDDKEFEFLVRDLMVRDGIQAERVGGKDDRGRDVFGRDRDGLMWVVQCKHTTVGANVGVKVVYIVNGTARQFHGADRVLIVTNGGFTASAIRCADQADIHLIGRDELIRWASDRYPLHEVLGIGPGPGTSIPRAS